MPKSSESNDYLFTDRLDAAQKLLEVLPHELMRKEKWLLLALSRGAVEITSTIANRLDLEYDLLLVAPILAPENDECEIAMVSETKEIVMHTALLDSFEIDENYIYEEARRIHDENIMQKINQFRFGLPLMQIEDRNILLIDEGCETGLSTLCAIKSVLNLGAKKVSIGVPVIAEDLFGALDLIVDKIYAAKKMVYFITTEYYYEQFYHLKKRMVIELLEKDGYFVPNTKES